MQGSQPLSQQSDGSVNLTVGVTIGYDTPWRQVHAMLIAAALLGERPGLMVMVGALVVLISVLAMNLEQRWGVAWSNR